MGKVLEGDPMGLYYISEVSNEGCNTLESVDVVDKGHGIFYVTYEQVLQSFDVLNRNGRKYDGNNVWSCIQNSEKIQSQLKHNGWFMEMDHPMQLYKDQPLTPERIRNISYDRRCAVIKNPRKVGSLLKARIETTNNNHGEGIAKDIIAHGYQPMASARAIANLINRNGEPYVEVKQLITYDLVNYASHREADTDVRTIQSKIANPITESASGSVRIHPGDILMPLKEILESVSKTDVNTQMIMESFELTSDDLIGFNKPRTQVIIKDKNNTIYANISPETTRKVNDFFSNF